ncbi:MAG: hypothetical protein JSS87_14780 [Acidobacteria bacterium]|nr:hypothetical protein [Acidobacteriota bacterium]
MSHLPPSVSGEARKAAETDCTFAFDSQLGAADTWAGNADEHVATSYAKGRDELRAFWARIYAEPGFKLEWWPLTAEQHGSFVVTTGESRRTMVDKQGKTHVSTGHYITVWKRQPDGTYRFVWDGGE